jgi:hypothetical protein
MKLNPKVIQILGDGIIPLLGYFLWDWSLYFILLFYFLDLITKEVLLHLKTKKIKTIQHHNDRSFFKKWFFKGTISIVTLSISTFLVQYMMYCIHPDFSAWKEIVDFISYTEMGIPQGLLLIPLVIVMGYVQFKNEFIKPKRYLTQKFESLWKQHLTSNLMILAGAGLGLGISSFIILPEWLFVIAIVIVSGVYQMRSSN